LEATDPDGLELVRESFFTSRLWSSECVKFNALSAAALLALRQQKRKLLRKYANAEIRHAHPGLGVPKRRRW
jgi:hypothetical protein